MKDLKIKVQKNGSGLRIYFDKVLTTVFGLAKDDQFTVEMKKVKGIKTIILKEVEGD